MDMVMGITVGMIVGVGAGWLFAKMRINVDERVLRLENELNDRQSELEHYKAEVSEHFGQTARLFNQLNADYRAVYEHLAAGSEALCGDQAVKLTGELPDQGTLEGEKADPAAIEEKEEQIRSESASQADERSSEELVAETNEVTPPASAEMAAEAETEEEANTAEAEAPGLTSEEAARTIH